MELWEPSVPVAGAGVRTTGVTVTGLGVSAGAPGNAFPKGGGILAGGGEM